MATCLRCKFTDLIWKKSTGKWRLYDPISKKWHEEFCRMSQEEYKKHRRKIKCQHGVSVDKYCTDCFQEKYTG